MFALRPTLRPPAPDFALRLYLSQGISSRAVRLEPTAVHPWISGRAQRIRMLRRLLEHVLAHSDVWVATALEIAQHHQESDNTPRFQERLEPLDTDF